MYVYTVENKPLKFLVYYSDVPTIKFERIPTNVHCIQ